MKQLLVTTAIIEVGVGVALLAVPSLLVSLLLGTSLETPAGLVVCRIAGAALLSLGTACWLARNDGPSRSAIGLAAAILLYNIAAVAVLTGAGIGSEMVGVALWPAVGLHGVMGIWCVGCLRKNRLD